MFMKEKKVNENYMRIIEDAKVERDDAVGQKDGLLKAREDLQLEVKRKIRLAMVTQAAREGMQAALKEAKDTIRHQENDIQRMLAAMESNENEKATFRNRHDEMFNQTSALNARIEELENHKLLLLDKLKGYGDKGSLDYIIKT